MTPEPAILEDYQARAVDWLATTKRGIVVASAGSGKTILMSAAIQKVTLSRPRTTPVNIGWMAATIEQCQQASSALDRFPIPGGMASIRIQCAAADTDWTGYDLLVVDECHHSPASQWCRQVQACTGARWGCTATPFGEDPDRNNALLNLFDHNVFTISREEVSSRLVPAKVFMLDAFDPGIAEFMDREIEQKFERMKKWSKLPEWKLRANIAWRVCIERGIIQNRARNAAVLELARQHRDDSVLVLINDVKHAEALTNQIPWSAMCYSGMGDRARRETLDAFKAGTIKCIVATSLADEGLDVPIANVLILVSGGRSSAKTEQRTGRVLRVAPGKEHGIIYDFTDKPHTLMSNHARKRLATYRKLGYEIHETPSH